MSFLYRRQTKKSPLALFCLVYILKKSYISLFFKSVYQGTIHPKYMLVLFGKVGARGKIAQV